MSTTISPAFVRFLAMAMATALDREQQRNRLLGTAGHNREPPAQARSTSVKEPDQGHTAPLPVTGPAADWSGLRGPAVVVAAAAGVPAATLAQAAVAPPAVSITPVLPVAAPQGTLGGAVAPLAAPTGALLATSPLATGPAVVPAPTAHPASTLPPPSTAQPASAAPPTPTVPAVVASANGLFGSGLGINPPGLDGSPFGNGLAMKPVMDPLIEPDLARDSLETGWPDLPTQLLAEAHLREALARIIRDDALRHGLSLKE